MVVAVACNPEPQKEQATVSGAATPKGPLAMTAAELHAAYARDPHAYDDRVVEITGEILGVESYDNQGRVRLDDDKVACRFGDVKSVERLRRGQRVSLTCRVVKQDPLGGIMADMCDASASPKVLSEPAEVPTSPKVHKSRCLKAARSLFARAKKCGIDIQERTAEKTCTELFEYEGFTDAQAVERMAVMTEDGCESLRVAIEADRI
ncbi:MAG: hypothetical protein AB7O24_13365 [Kofleriaceae bacterium]